MSVRAGLAVMAVIAVYFSVFGITTSTATDCGDYSSITLADMGDGDRKIMSVHGYLLTIGQPGLWNLTSTLDATCSAVIDFKAR
jgi:hypothetical protein